MFKSFIAAAISVLSFSANADIITNGNTTIVGDTHTLQWDAGGDRYWLRTEMNGVRVEGRQSGTSFTITGLEPGTLTAQVWNINGNKWTKTPQIVYEVVEEAIDLGSEPIVITEEWSRGWPESAGVDETMADQLDFQLSKIMRCENGTQMVFWNGNFTAEHWGPSGVIGNEYLGNFYIAPLAFKLLEDKSGVEIFIPSDVNGILELTPEQIAADEYVRQFIRATITCDPWL